MRVFAFTGGSHAGEGALAAGHRWRSAPDRVFADMRSLPSADRARRRPLDGRPGLRRRCRDRQRAGRHLRPPRRAARPRRASDRARPPTPGDRRARRRRRSGRRSAPPFAGHARHRGATPGRRRRHQLRRHLLAGRARGSGGRLPLVRHRGDAALGHHRLVRPPRASPRPRNARPPATAVLDYLGGAMSPEMQLPKLMWLKRHLPGHLAPGRPFLRPRRFSDLEGDADRWRARNARWPPNGPISAHAERLAARFPRRIGLDDLLQRGALPRTRRARSAPISGR